MYFVGDDEPVEVFSERNPLEILIGMGEMLESFEKELIGKKAGDQLSFVIKKENAFGEFNDDLVKNYPIELFHNDQGEIDERFIYEGAIISLDTEEKDSQDAFVIEIFDDEILLDLNHPFAGEDLKYELMIMSVRLSD
jgi:FKBP-type peptidyl-prolyl cis-trans isomerase SlyD